jgi:MFS family permease
VALAGGDSGRLPDRGSCCRSRGRRGFRGGCACWGLIAGAIIEAAQWSALRQWVSWLWILATSVGMALGLAAGAALVDYGIDRGDVVLLGAVTGVGVGVAQALVLARRRVPGAFWWAIANPPAWALGWLMTSYVISTNVDEQFTNFGASGALVYGLLTWLLLAVLLRATAPEVRGTTSQ